MFQEEGIATYAMTAKIYAHEMQNDNQKDNCEEQDHKHFHPAWCAGGRGGIGARLRQDFFSEYNLRVPQDSIRFSDERQ